ncbi:MAG: GNAT family N-acetyltransferase [Erythrobacter sp.]|nr:GNAT family N-acetyltransferase [Erythrobacter sp.]
MDLTHHGYALPATPRAQAVEAGGALLCAADWQALERFSTLPTQEYAFADALAGTMLRDTRIATFTVAGPEGLAALLPLCRDEGDTARWRMVGADEVFEPGDALCADPQAALALARQLVADGRPLTFDRLPTTSLLIPALRTAMRGRGLVTLRPAVAHPTIALDASWHDPQARFKPRRQSDFRRARRRADQFGTVSFEWLTPSPAEFDPLFDEAVQVEASGWKQQACTALASDPVKCAFFRRYFATASASGRFHLAVMRIDGRAMAVQMAVDFRQGLWLFKIGFDEAFAKASPGTLLMLFAIGEAARRGFRAFEMLGEAEDWISRFWTSDQHDCVHLRSYPFNRRGMAALLADGHAWLRHRLAKLRA